MKSVAIIPARGGSRRIPKKNIRSFAGRPMIAWPIDAARQSGMFERIIVSTDDDRIAEIATNEGAEAPFVRPANLADDHTGTAAVIGHAVNWLMQTGDCPDAVCCIYATAPFLQPSDLVASGRILEQGQWNYVFSATEFAFPIFRAFRVLESGGCEMFYPEHRMTRSQDLPVAMHDAGQFYWGRPQAWIEDKPMFDRLAHAFQIPSWRVQDIDTEDDWKRAEILWKTLQEERSEH